MKRKSIFALAIIAVLTITSGVSVFAATSQSFAGTTRGDSWQRVSASEIKKTSSEYPWVTWTYSEHGNTHKQWFTIVPKGASNGVGEVLLAAYGSANFLGHEAKSGNYYYLKSKREHIVDPGTYIKGNWSPS